MEQEERPLFKVETTATFYVQPGQKVIIEGVSVGGDLVVKLLKSSRDVSTQTTDEHQSVKPSPSPEAAPSTSSTTLPAPEATPIKSPSITGQPIPQSLTHSTPSDDYKDYGPEDMKGLDIGDYTRELLGLQSDSDRDSDEDSDADSDVPPESALTSAQSPSTTPKDIPCGPTKQLSTKCFPSTSSTSLDVGPDDMEHTGDQLGLQNDSDEDSDEENGADSDVIIESECKPPVSDESDLEMSSDDSYQIKVKTKRKLRLDSEDEEHKPKKQRPVQIDSADDFTKPKSGTRKYKMCPVPGCKAKPQQKLSNHLKQKHPHLTKANHAKALKMAETAKLGSKKTARHIKNQPSLRSFISTPNPDPVENYDELIARKQGTRPFPQFDVDGKNMSEFVQWLMGVEGRKRDEREARQIAVEISKLLRYNSKLFSWESLLEDNSTCKYLEACEEAGVKSNGLVTKCERIITALNFLRLQKTQKTNYDRQAEITSTISRVESWKKTFRRMKEDERAVRDSSPLLEDISTVDDLLNNKEIWDEFDRLCSLIHTDIQLTSQDLTLMTAAVASALMFESVQRPGAVSGATLKEYHEARLVDGVWVIQVKSHKTSRHGPARLTVNDEIKDKVDRYVQLARSQIDPFEENTKLLVLPGGQPVQVNVLLRTLRRRYNIPIPTATSVRKTVATKAATECSSNEVAILSRQMSHSVETHRRDYEKMGGSSKAVEAYKITKKLIKEKPVLPKKKRMYTPEEERKIQDFFNDNIMMRRRASLGECRKFLQIFTLQRSPKDIQDKVANIIKYSEA